MSNLYNIAGLIVSMETFGRTLKQAEPYRYYLDKKADIIIKSNIKAIKNKYKDATDEMAEYLSSGSSFYSQLLQYDGLLLHASAVVVEGKAYLFSAYSGTGKSTHTKLWLDFFGEKAFILNDDKPALRFIEGKWYAFGTPWSGKDDISANIGVELAGIAVIERAEKNEILPYTGTQAIFDLYCQTSRTKDAELREKMLVLFDLLFKHISVWKLKCNMEIEAAEIAFNAMSKGLRSK